MVVLMVVWMDFWLVELMVVDWVAKMVAFEVAMMVELMGVEKVAMWVARSEHVSAGLLALKTVVCSVVLLANMRDVKWAVKLEVLMV